MNAIFKIFFLAWGSLFLFACQDTQVFERVNDHGQKIIEERNAEGQVLVRKTFTNESENDFLFEKYSADGEIIDSCFLQNEKYEGLRSWLDEETGLKHYENYSDGKLEGRHFAVFPNGVKSFSGYHHGQLQDGEWIFRKENGELLSYEFYVDGRVAYYRHYQDGFCNDSEGEGLISFQLGAHQVHVDEELSLKYEAVQPPDLILQVSVTEIVNGELHSIPYTVSEYQTLHFSFNQPGEHTLRLHLEYRNPDRKVIHTYDKPLGNVLVIKS